MTTTNRVTGKDFATPCISAGEAYRKLQALMERFGHADASRFDLRDLQELDGVIARTDRILRGVGASR